MCVMGLKVWARLLCLVALLPALKCGTGEARAKFNSLKTGLQTETHKNPASSTPVGSLQVYPCSNDLACGERRFCHAPSRSPSPKSCHTCRRKKRRCLRDAMCCPGNHCSNNVCTPLSARVTFHRIPAVREDTKMAGRQKSGGNKRTKLPSVKGHVGDPCLRSSDCSQGHCCARHFWARICKPVLKQGEVCTRQRRKGHAGLELFQRCDCGRGLACKAAQLSTPSSSSSSLLKSTGAGAAKGRLHLCQRQ